MNASVAADHLQHGGFRRQHRTTPLTALCAALFAIVAMGHGRLVVRHPHQREPRPDRRAVRCGHRAARRLCGHQRRRMDQGAVRPGPVYSAGLRIRLGRGQADWSSCCRNMDRRSTTGFFGGAQIARRRGYGVHARRTGRPEVYGRFHAGHLSGQRDRTTSPISRSRCG